MTTDRTSQTLTLRDGRTLGYAEYGEPQGKPVFHFHGSSSSRLEHPPDETLLPSLGIRLITADRPGHGLSDIRDDYQLSDWPDDVAELADHLKIGEFYTMGWSAGGPRVLACAYKLPDRLVAGATVSGFAPLERPGATDGMPLTSRLAFWSGRRAPWLAGLLFRMMTRMVSGDAERAARRLLSSVPEADKKLLESPQDVDMLLTSLREGCKPGWQGSLQDVSLMVNPWGFSLGAITTRIDIWQGEADVNVPLHAGQYLRDTLPDSRATFLPGEGHFYVLKRWGEILSALIE